MTTSLYRLVYCSRNAVAVASGDLTAEMGSILAASRANNARDGVTGALLYSEGCFVQVLEGGLHDVERTFERIQCDPRHGDVIVLQAGPVTERFFGAWEMALAQCADPEKASTTLNRALAEPTGAAGAEVVAMLQGLVQREEDWAHAVA